MQIYFDVISAIMTEKGLIEMENKIDTTELGTKFYNDYSNVNDLINEITQRLT